MSQQGIGFTDLFSNAYVTDNNTFAKTDVTLIAKNRMISAHKLILSAFSQFLQSVLKDVPTNDHAYISLPDIEADDVEAVVRFIYCGEINIPADQIEGLFRVAHILQINGLLEMKASIETVEEIVELEESNLIDISASEFAFEESESALCLPQNLQYNIIEEDTNQLGVDSVRLKKGRRRLVPGKPKGQTLYSENSLRAAVEELRGGARLSDTAAKFSIPKSTLYLHAKERGAVVALQRAERSEEGIKNAMQAVLEGLSLKQAGERFNIPKTVLWRRLQKDVDKGTPTLLSQRRKLQDPVLKEKSREALQKGQSVSIVAKQFNVPVATVFREKKKLVELGRLDPSAIRSTCKSHVLKAAQAVLSGHSLNNAAAMFNVARTTVWRHLQEMEKQENR